LRLSKSNSEQCADSVQHHRRGERAGLANAVDDWIAAYQMVEFNCGALQYGVLKVDLPVRVQLAPRNGDGATMKTKFIERAAPS